MKLKYYWEKFQNRFKEIDFASRCQLIGVTDQYEHPYWKYLFSSLHFDLSFVDYCEEVLLEIKKVRLGKIEKTGWSGNAFNINIYFDRVEIDHQQFGGLPEWPIWTCSLIEFKIALEGWKHFLEMPVNASTRLIVELPDRLPYGIKLPPT